MTISFHTCMSQARSGFIFHGFKDSSASNSKQISSVYAAKSAKQKMKWEWSFTSISKNQSVWLSKSNFTLHEFIFFSGYLKFYDQDSFIIQHKMFRWNKDIKRHSNRKELEWVVSTIAKMFHFLFEILLLLMKFMSPRFFKRKMLLLDSHIFSKHNKKIVNSDIWYPLALPLLHPKPSR